MGRKEVEQRGWVPAGDRVTEGGYVPTSQAPELAPPAGGFNTPPAAVVPTVSSEGDS